MTANDGWRQAVDGELLTAVFWRWSLPLNPFTPAHFTCFPQERQIVSQEYERLSNFYNTDLSTIESKTFPYLMIQHMKPFNKHPPPTGIHTQEMVYTPYTRIWYLGGVTLDLLICWAVFLPWYGVHVRFKKKFTVSTKAKKNIQYQYPLLHLKFYY